MPAKVYTFLLDTLREDEYKLSDDLLHQSVDVIETTEDCFRFFIGKECILVLCSQPEKNTKNYVYRLSQNYFEFYNWVLSHFNISFISTRID